jgi:hypothetical protein
MICILPLVFTSCKRDESPPSLPSKKAEPQAVFPNTKAEPQAEVPKGHGVLTIFVEDENGKPLEGAEIRIANNRGETYTTRSRKDGTTKGAGLVSESPFTATAMLAGYEAQQAQGIALSEVQPIFIALKLKRTRK